LPLLLQIDQLPCHVLVVAATNHSEFLDSAVWRHIVVEVGLAVEFTLSDSYQTTVAGCACNPARTASLTGCWHQS
jgi:hypothetical protein